MNNPPRADPSGEARGANFSGSGGVPVGAGGSSPPAPFRSSSEPIRFRLHLDPRGAQRSGDRRHTAARRVGGGRKAHPTRHPPLDLGTPVRAVEMVQRDLPDGLGPRV